MDQVDKCANTQCPIAKNGKCIEGLVKEQCPHYGKEPLGAAEPTEGNAAVESNSALPEAIEGRLMSSELLSQSQADRHFCSQRSYCISLVGPNEAGKTSLFASLYDLFQEGPFAGYACKWCETLHGFEIACHHSRLASQRTIPYTERTKLRAGLRYYQLTLRGEGRDLNLLLADRAGEFYNDAASVPTKAADFEELRRADAIAVLLDGAKLIENGQRHGAKANLEMTLQGIIDSGVLGPVRRLAIVLTKMDLVLSSPRAEAAVREYASYANKLRDQFQAHFSEIQSFQVSSSPSATGTVERGHGLKALFDFWIAAAPPLLETVDLKPSVRQFQRVRNLPEDVSE